MFGAKDSKTTVDIDKFRRPLNVLKTMKISKMLKTLKTSRNKHEKHEKCPGG
jgi:hypothetical protein